MPTRQNQIILINYVPHSVPAEVADSCKALKIALTWALEQIRVKNLAVRLEPYEAALNTLSHAPTFENEDEQALGTLISASMKSNG